MKPLIYSSLIVLLILFASCSSTQPVTDLTLPQLVYQQPLPAYPKALSTSMLRIPLEIHISKTGTVTDVIILKGSGVPSWDSAAVASIRQWKYTPARVKENPIGIWLHQTAVVKFSEPHIMMLAEIICAGPMEADSAFQMLERGEPFSDAVRLYSVATTRVSDGHLGPVNIQMYPEPVKNSLAGLRKGTYTKPIPYGDRYAIFLRQAE